MINARSETAAEKPAFRQAYQSRRCIIPTDGFYEWQQLAARARQPWFIHMSDDTVTRAEVIAAVATDPRLETTAERCEVYALLTKRSSGMTLEEYAAIED